MTIVYLYHYNRCSKSRQALQFMTEQSVSFELIDYHASPPSVETICDLMARSNHEPIEFVRKSSDIELRPGGTLTDIATFLYTNPQHLQRPIIDVGTHVIIARPLKLLAALPRFSSMFTDQ